MELRVLVKSIVRVKLMGLCKTIPLIIHRVSAEMRLIGIQQATLVRLTVRRFGMLKKESVVISVHAKIIRYLTNKKNFAK